MKKLLLLFSFAFLFSCQKDHCRRCITTYYENSIEKGVIIRKFILCSTTTDINEVNISLPLHFPVYWTTCEE